MGLNEMGPGIISVVESPVSKVTSCLMTVISISPPQQAHEVASQQPVNFQGNS